MVASPSRGLVVLTAWILAGSQQSHAWTSRVSVGLEGSRCFARQTRAWAKKPTNKGSRNAASTPANDQVSKLKALLQEKEEENERLSQQVAVYQKEMASMMVKQHEAKLDAVEKNSRLEARVDTYQQEMSSLIVKQHHAQLALVREKERLASSVDLYQREMANMLVKQHEARLQAVATVEATLKKQIAAVEESLRSEQETSSGLRRELRQTIMNLGRSKAEAVQEMQEQIDALKQEIGQRDDQVELMTETLRDVMVNSHEMRLNGANQEKEEKRALEELIKDLKEELVDIKQARDEYIRERDLMLEALGDP